MSNINWKSYSEPLTAGDGYLSFFFSDKNKEFSSCLESEGYSTWSFLTDGVINDKNSIEQLEILRSCSQEGTWQDMIFNSDFVNNFINNTRNFNDFLEPYREVLKQHILPFWMW